MTCLRVNLDSRPWKCICLLGLSFVAGLLRTKTLGLPSSVRVTFIWCPTLLESPTTPPWCILARSICLSSVLTRWVVLACGRFPSVVTHLRQLRIANLGQNLNLRGRHFSPLWQVVLSALTLILLYKTWLSSGCRTFVSTCTKAAPFVLPVFSSFYIFGARATDILLIVAPLWHCPATPRTPSLTIRLP